MSTYIGVVCLITILYMIYYQKCRSVDLETGRIYYKKLYCIAVTVIMVALSGLRHISIGADTLTYYEYGFKNAAQKSVGEILEGFLFFNDEKGEAGYALFEKIVGSLCRNYQIYLIIIAIIFMFSLCYFIYKNSVDCYISYIIFFTNYFLFFGTTGLRQTLAQAILLTFGYSAVKKRKFFLFLFVILFAVTFHKSAIIFFPYYFIYNIKINFKSMSAYFVVFTLVLVGRWPILYFLNDVLGYGADYVTQIQGAGTPTYSLLLAIITIVSVYLCYKRYFYKQEVVGNVNAILIATMFVPFTFIDPNLMRALYYYSIFLILLIPEIVQKFNSRDRKILKIISVSLLLLLFFRAHPSYRFFWQ